VAAGRVTEAILLHERNLVDRERVLGPDHPGSLTSQSNLAAYREAGRAARRSRCSSGPWPTASGCWARITRHPGRPGQPRRRQGGTGLMPAHTGSQEERGGMWRLPDVSQVMRTPPIKAVLI
jgi:hypothetical protein